jgi:hypothetical protein
MPSGWCSWIQASLPGSRRGTHGLLSPHASRPAATPFPHYLEPMLKDRITTGLGFFITLLLVWLPGGLIDQGRQAAAPIQPFTSLLDR